jgi:hypothetical protein
VAGYFHPHLVHFFRHTSADAPRGCGDIELGNSRLIKTHKCFPEYAPLGPSIAGSFPPTSFRTSRPAHSLRRSSQDRAARFGTGTALVPRCPAFTA